MDKFTLLILRETLAQKLSLLVPKWMYHQVFVKIVAQAYKKYPNKQYGSLTVKEITTALEEINGY